MQPYYKKEVSCKAFDPIFYFARSNNVELNSLIKDVPYTLSYLLNRRERVEWSVWCKIIKNSNQFFSPQDYNEMGSNFVKRGSYFEGLLWAFFLFTSSKFSRFLVKSIFQIGASMFSCMNQKTEFLDTNRIRITAFVGQGFEYCPEFFFICKGVWEQLGTQLGQKNFKVLLDIKNQQGIFDVSWNKESIIFKIKRGFRWLFNIRKALLEITDSHEALLNQYEKLETSQKLLQKQTTQLKTAYEISTSIRQSININDTLNAIANSLINEGRYSFVSINLFNDIDGNEVQINAEAGNKKQSSYSFQHEIVIDEKKVGELTLIPSSEMEYSECKEILEYLTPVINIAVHNALTLSAVVDYRNNLEQKVAYRTFELQKARDELTETNRLLAASQQAQNCFFANISHEFRTPLTLIMGPSKHLMTKSNDENIKTDADLIHRSAKKLNRLVDELLDISKIEAGEMKLKACPMNLVEAVRGITLSFASLAERKKIEFTVTAGADNITAYIDKDKFEKILNNVLSNAFKFTPEGGKVEVGIRCQAELVSAYTKQNKIPKQVRDDKLVVISIRDTGIGIPQHEKEKIFDRFYQVDSSHTRQHEGTGIGLALTKELVELHKGKIEVESEEGKGSTFRLFFPLGKEHLKADEICQEENEEDKDDGRDKDEDKELQSFELEDVTKKSKPDILASEYFEIQTPPSLLIVEDNADVRKYICSILDNHYKIYEAEDGESGLQNSFEFIPDLIITDIMMPKLDGFQMCNKLKNDERTSHIPIIMLTAKATMEDKISGLDIGADEYIMKPFEPKELIARIKNLLEQRKRLHEHFRKFGLVDIDEKQVSSLDQEFMQKVIRIINEHISDTLFGVEMLAENMSVTKAVLLRKTEALIGEAPVDLIKRVRLNTAAKLLEARSANVSEIALEVGFNNPSYFAECFKKQFGVSPSQYHRRAK